MHHPNVIIASLSTTSPTALRQLSIVLPTALIPRLKFLAAAVGHGAGGKAARAIPKSRTPA